MPSAPNERRTEPNSVEAIKRMIEQLIRVGTVAQEARDPEAFIGAWRKFFSRACDFDAVLDAWIRVRAWTKEQTRKLAARDRR